MKALKLVRETKVKSPSISSLLKSDFGSNPMAKASVMNIFADCHDDNLESAKVRCLNAVTELDAQDLVPTAKKAVPHGYNSFRWQRLEAILEVLLKAADFQDLDNPEAYARDVQKRARNYTFRFGREGSPVLYIRCVHRVWHEDFSSLAKASKADEISIEADGSIRLWWD
jgi:hypothetical protein